MAEKYIINMPLKTTPDDTDLMIIEDAQDTKRITWANFVKPIEDLVDKEPTNFEVVMNEGYSYSSLANNYIKKNGWVFLTLQAARGGSNFEKDIVHNIAEMPVGFRPISNAQFSAKSVNTGLRCNAILNTSGILSVQIMSSEVSGTTTNIFVCLTYYAGGGTV